MRRPTLLAKEATTHAAVDVQVNPELQDVYTDIEARINDIVANQMG